MRILSLQKVILFVGLILPITSSALIMEVGVNYSYKKTTLDSLNNVEQQGTTGSLAFYIWEQISIELSYTSGLYVKKEKQDATAGSTTVRTTTQYTDVYGTDLVYVFSDKKSRFQPFIKGGAAYIKKKQVVQIGTDPAFEIEPKPGWAPSYGVGAKYFITEALAIKAGYDVVRTPIDDTATADDVTGRIGLSWMF